MDKQVKTQGSLMRSLIFVTVVLLTASAPSLPAQARPLEWSSIWRDQLPKFKFIPLNHHQFLGLEKPRSASLPEIDNDSNRLPVNSYDLHDARFRQPRSSTGVVNAERRLSPFDEYLKIPLVLERSPTRIIPIESDEWSRDFQPMRGK